MAAKIKKGDQVIIIAGRDKGMEGEVQKVLLKDQKVLVQGANLVKKHQKPSQSSPEGGIISFESPIAISNVAHKDPKTGKPVRVGFKRLEDGRKVRFSKQSGEVIDV